MLRAIREIQPTWIVGENVLGLVNWNGGLVFDEVQADLETEGYEVQPFILPACAVNAPHRRDRVWFIAYSNNTGSDHTMRNHKNGQEKNQRREKQLRPKFGQTSDNEIITNANGERQSRKKHGETKSRQHSKESISKWFENFPTQSPILSGNDGISSRLDGITFSKWRNESIKAAGNAIVPQVALQIFKAIKEYNDL